MNPEAVAQLMLYLHDLLNLCIKAIEMTVTKTASEMMKMNTVMMMMTTTMKKTTMTVESVNFL